MNKLTDVAFKGNFEFRTIKAIKSLWVIEYIDPNCNWRLRASKTAEESDCFVIRKYVGIHSCSLLCRNANHHQVTYVVVSKQVALQFVGGQKGPIPKVVQTFAYTNLKSRINYYKV